MGSGTLNYDRNMVYAYDNGIRLVCAVRSFGPFEDEWFSSNR